MRMGAGSVSIDRRAIEKAERLGQLLILLLKKIARWVVDLSFFLISPTGLTLSVLIVFSASLTWFFYVVANTKMELMEIVQFKDQYRNLIIGLGTIAIFVIEEGGIRTDIQKQLLSVFKWVITLTYLIVIGVYFFIITQPYQYLLALDVGTFTVTVSILVAGIKHKIFSE